MKIKRKTLITIKKWVYITLCVAGVSSLFYVYYKTDVFTITSYRLLGLEGEDTLAIAKDLTDASHHYSYFIFPNNKIVTYSRKRLEDVIVSYVPDSKSVSIYPAGLHVIGISVIRNEPLFRISNERGITRDGIIFTTNKDISGLPLLIATSSTEHTVTLEGLTFSKIDGINEPFLTALSSFISKVSQVVFPVRFITIEENGDISLSDETGRSKILFVKDMDMVKAWSTLLSAIDTEPLKSKVKGNMQDLEYLDIRFGNKVFYKFSTTPFQRGALPAIIGDHDATTTVATTTRQ